MCNVHPDPHQPRVDDGGSYTDGAQDTEAAANGSQLLPFIFLFSIRIRFSPVDVLLVHYVGCLGS